MAITTNGFSTYAQIGIKEEVSNIITNLTPDETPFYSTVKKQKIKNRLYEWQTDTLDAPSSNAQLEGDDVTPATTSATTLLNNRTQISYKSLAVTDTSRAVATYGRGDEYDYQVMKRGRELKTDVEIGLLKNTAKATGGTATTRVCAGLPTFITNLGRGTAPTGDGSDAIGVATALPVTALTYAMCATTMTQAFEDGGNPTMMMLPPTLKRSFSSLAYSSTPSTADVRYNINKNQPAIAVGTVEKWLSDFGTVDVVVNRQMARVTSSTGIGGTSNTLDMLNRAVLFVDPQNVSAGILQDTEVVELSKLGLSDRAFIRCEYTLIVNGPAAHGIIPNVS